MLSTDTPSAFQFGDETMKKIALALLCVFATGSVAAQTYACQFIMQTGMDKEPAGWKTQTFNLPEPFFLTMSNGSIESESLAKPPLKMVSIPRMCNKFDSVSGVLHWCADWASYLSFSEKTLSGGFANTFGAMQSPNDTEIDSVTVARYKCQKVR